MQDKIPFNRPFIVGKELFYIAQAVLDGRLAGNGPFTKKCERWMEETFGAKKVLLTNSCTAALEMAAILAGTQPGDEVIMPSFTFVSTANAFVLRGAKIRFVDIRPDTLNLDETLIEAAITPETKAIVPVHYAGVGCEMDPIMDIAEKHDLLVIEDAAQGVVATYRDRQLGTIGHLGAYSFHETKNFISGEGGALIVNDDRFSDRADILLNKGTNRSQFLRGEVDKYTWVDIGSSYLPSEMIAAFLFAQLENVDVITRRRQEIFNLYYEHFEDLEERGLLTRPRNTDHTQHNAHMFYIILRTGEERNEMMDFLRDRGILAVFHYVPLHLAPMGKAMGYSEGMLPLTEDLSARLLRLPCYFELGWDDQKRVIDAVRDFWKV